MALEEKQIAPKSEIRMPMANFCGGCVVVEIVVGFDDLIYLKDSVLITECNLCFVSRLKVTSLRFGTEFYSL